MRILELTNAPKGLLLCFLTCASACNNITPRANIVEDPARLVDVQHSANIEIPPLLADTLKSGVDKFTGITKVLFTLKTPGNTPADSSIYLSGTFDDWSGGNDEKYRFTKISSNTYSLEVEELAGSVLQFKVTRGAWEFAEADERGRRVGNRVLVIRDKPIEIELVVSQWNDKSDVTENADRGYWNTAIPNYHQDPTRPTLTLTGDKTVMVSTIDDYKELGASAKNALGEDISHRVEISKNSSLKDSGDFIVSYTVTDNEQGQAIPVSRVVRVIGESSPAYSLRAIGSTSSHYGYVEQLPSDYGKDSSKKYPLFIYHHGAGGEASSLNFSREYSLRQSFDVWDGGPARIAMRGHWNTDSPLLVLSPQRSFFAADMARIDTFVDFAIQTYQVDPKRIYMGGFSAGGFISWEYAMNFPDKVAAIVPLAGGLLNGAANICNAKNVAVWAFHSVVDKAVDVTQAKEAISAYNQCQPETQAKLTLFDNRGHSIHQQVLELRGMSKYLETGDAFNQNLYTWMLAQ